MTIRIKRVYEPAETTDGYRVLVDRLWPRGIKKTDLPYDEWRKDVTPSTELRKEYHSGQLSHDEFRERYLAELDGNPGVVELALRAEQEPLTLLIAGKDVANSHANVLIEAMKSLSLSD